MIWTLRDPDGHDPGTPDKRLLVVEPEFASLLKAHPANSRHCHRPFALRGTVRPLAVLTRTAPARATDAHVAIIGHITDTELRRYASAIEIANGLLNRFILAVGPTCPAAARRR